MFSNQRPVLFIFWKDMKLTLPDLEYYVLTKIMFLR